MSNVYEKDANGNRSNGDLNDYITISYIAPYFLTGISIQGTAKCFILIFHWDIWDI